MMKLIRFRVGPATVLMTMVACCPGMHSVSVVISMALGEQAPSQVGLVSR